MPEPTTPKVPTRAHQAKSSARGFSRIPTVMTADEVIESAFRRASKISVPHGDASQRMKSTEVARVRAVQNGISSTLEGYVKRFPSFDQLPPFYQDLAVVLVDLDRTRKALGAIDWAAKRVKVVGDEAAAEMKKSGYGELVLRAKSQAYGRISSLVKQVDED